MNILIPSYEPDERLLMLIKQLRDIGSFPIVVVDDGSGEAYSQLFIAARELGCTVITHSENRGKGHALKSGFRYFMQNSVIDGIVCADSDGQHLPQDIMKIASSIEEHNHSIVLGCRRFTGKVPLRSRFGNAATRLVYTFATGKRIYDTQTGLRGYSADMLDWLCRIPGERFEYEMNLLLEAPAAGFSFHEVAIDTVYLDHNKSSHFRPIIDSARIYAPFLKFSISSLSSAVIDILLLALIHFFSSSLLLAVMGARLTSSIFNYTMNKRFVFDRGKPSAIRTSMPKYFALVIVIFSLNYGLMHVFNERLGVPLLIAKLFTEAALFVFSYWAQRKFVY
ncbi:bifunctional glycosyltransferase family 2/GtrA family protein [Paenibacillus sp. LHD-38]|uniref:bifunctional glycosyltransferase family 2/GtrA family protein n=1 Tax=Paenibacillus sp. LHD-38 TaxID=3072143 RepID=UPI00280FF946|nr:bifunctional glycosyltransferase family 2/GtrA family protein [Paenibacillus sp. LHD-38]MDQ8735003.1 bifunctional glycosyltransferase family 2/GtrA family protein [Paenibacillus sp. LHD-38]